MQPVVDEGRGLRRLKLPQRVHMARRRPTPTHGEFSA